MTREGIKMTNDEAKSVLFNMLGKGIYVKDTKENRAILVALRALEQEPCEDRIIEWKKDFKEYVNSLSILRDDYKGIMEYIDELPVTPQPKIGHWIAQDIHNCHTNFKCSECDYIHSFMHLYGEPTADYTYCPNCGAKMEVEE